jgi:outer membrane lipase/esterase
MVDVCHGQEWGDAADPKIPIRVAAPERKRRRWLPVTLRRIWTLAGLLLGMITPASNSMAEPGFDQIVVIGDSLSDQGNAGRFSNGPVWVEQLAGRLGVSLAPSRTGGLNFAIGGARLDAQSGSDSLRAQADLFLRRPRPGGRTLYVVYGGGNDIFAAIGRPDGSAVLDRAIASLASILEDLKRLGPADVLVPNLPDVGITPAVRARGSAAAKQAERLSAQFNRALEDTLANTERGARIRIHRLDVWSMGERVKGDPHALGFTDVTRPCRGLKSCEGHLFWDDVHPTVEAHARLAAEAGRAVHR